MKTLLRIFLLGASFLLLGASFTRVLDVKLKTQEALVDELSVLLAQGILEADGAVSTIDKIPDVILLRDGGRVYFAAQGQMVALEVWESSSSGCRFDSRKKRVEAILSSVIEKVRLSDHRFSQLEVNELRWRSPAYSPSAP